MPKEVTQEDINNLVEYTNLIEDITEVVQLYSHLSKESRYLAVNTVMTRMVTGVKDED